MTISTPSPSGSPFGSDVGADSRAEQGSDPTGDTLSGAGRPTPDVQAELKRLIEADDTRLGQVYRALQRGLNADQIAEELEVSTSGFVSNYSQSLRALLDGELPAAPTVALAVARKHRSILRRRDLSPAVRAYLQTNLIELERRADDQTARVVEVQLAQEQTEEAEARNDVGVYVYALPHYLRYPFDPTSGRTLMKVGRSDSDVIVRFRSQTRTTALPEEPILLRIYRTDDTSNAAAEAAFHRLLEAADHYRNVARSAGREWFVTSTRFLDEVARAMRLPIVVVNDSVVQDQ